MSKRDERFVSIIQDLASRFLSIESNRTSLITVTSIEVNDRANKVTVLVTVFPTDKEEEAMEFLKRSRSDFRKFVEENSRIARIPMFDFKIDKGEKNRQRVEEVSNND